MKSNLFTKLARLCIIPFILGLACVGLVSSTFAPVAYADDEVCNNPSIPDSVKAASGCSSGGNLPELSNVIQSIVNGVIAVAGTVAVIFVVVGGINYMTSAGDTQKTIKARNTILYACIGLAICALAFVIVNFVVVNLLKSSGVDNVESVGNDDANLTKYVSSIVNGVIAVLGFACVVVVVIGGINYMTSAGDTQKVEKGKKTILYGLIGLVICVLAFLIVNYVIVNIIGGRNTGSGGGNTGGNTGGSTPGVDKGGNGGGQRL